MLINAYKLIVVHVYVDVDFEFIEKGIHFKSIIVPWLHLFHWNQAILQNTLISSNMLVNGNNSFVPRQVKNRKSLGQLEI